MTKSNSATEKTLQVWINDRRIDIAPNTCETIVANFTRDKNEAPASYSVTLWMDPEGRLFIRNGHLDHQQLLLNSRQFPRWHEHELVTGDKFQIGDKIIEIKGRPIASSKTAWCKLGSKLFTLPAGREVPVGVKQRDTIAYVKFDGTRFFVRDANDTSITIIKIGDRWLALAPLTLYMVSANDEIRFHKPRGRRIQFSRTGNFPDTSEIPDIETFAPSPPDAVESPSASKPEPIVFETKIAQWLLTRCYVNRNILNETENIDWLAVNRCTHCAGIFNSSVKLCPNDETKLKLLSFPLLQTVIVPEQTVPVNMGYRLRKPWLGDFTDGKYTSYYDARFLPTEERFVFETIAYERNDELLQTAFATMHKLHHPNILSTIAYGKLAHPGSKYNWIHYRLIERAKAINLKTVLMQFNYLGFEVVTQIMLQVCDALSYAHKMGVTHGNLSSAHIWLAVTADNDFTAKLTGFIYTSERSPFFPPETANVPMVQAFSASHDRVQIPSRLLAKCQLEGTTVPQSDIYQIGCVMYEAMTGQLPFGGRHALESVYNQLLGKKPQFDNTYFLIPKRLQAVIAKCLAYQPSDRYASIDELREALADFRSKKG